MKITRIGAQRLSLSDVRAITDFRSNTRFAHFAYINEQVLVLLPFQTDDAEELLDRTRRQIRLALALRGSYIPYDTKTERTLILLPGEVIAISLPGQQRSTEEMYEIAWDALEHGEIRAIVTGESLEADISPDDLAPSAADGAPGPDEQKCQDPGSGD